jgi:DNA-binding IclR family transcriptional regulator
MGKHTPLFATAKTAAALFEMTQGEFLALVEEGVLPRPQKIGPYERWETDELKAIVRGEKADGYEEIEW